MTLPIHNYSSALKLPVSFVNHSNYAHLITVYVSKNIWSSRNIQKVTHLFILPTFSITKIKINMYIIIYNIIGFKPLEDQK